MGRSHSNVPIRGTHREWYGFEACPKVIPKIHDINLKSVAFLHFFKHRNIAKAPFCMKTRLDFESAIEFIAPSENFIYNIEIKEKTRF